MKNKLIELPVLVKLPQSLILEEYGLGTYDCRHHDISEDFQSHEAIRWYCGKCQSVLFSTFITRSGTGVSDTDYVECPVCEDKTIRFYSLSYGFTQILINGTDRR